MLTTPLPLFRRSIQFRTQTDLRLTLRLSRSTQINKTRAAAIFLRL